MGRRSQDSSPQAASRRAGVAAQGHQLRTRRLLPIFSFLAAAGLILALTIAPDQVQNSFAATQSTKGPVQTLEIADVTRTTVVRDSYKVTEKKKEPVIVVRTAGAPAVGTPDPGSAQAIGHDMVLARGWGEDQFACLVSLFNRESHWNVYAANPSGAYGIPQALPGSKMASAGADWATNPATQISWGLGYIAARYGTPCGAWGHSQSTGWY
ncbi:transglycosylase SLT domain-containing protein [Lacisediminihabitans sp. H27-G8]|uniref:aggregation-promoting factor C-terminal-like domain-containing protein n=1 Tax=Lacisediminihabitans sp. H27-G8 TaxID=3111909 RepID=UPI0038FC1334